MLALELDATPNQTQRFLLDEQECAITLKWMQDCFFMNISVNGVPVSSGDLCVIEALLPSWSAPGFSGKLMFLDMLGKDDPRSEGLGTRWKLFYIAREEFPFRGMNQNG